MPVNSSIEPKNDRLDEFLDALRKQQKPKKKIKKIDMGRKVVNIKGIFSQVKREIIKQNHEHNKQ